MSADLSRGIGGGRGRGRGGVEIVEVLPLKGDNPSVVTGFPGPGFIGGTAVMHIVRSLGLRHRAYLRSRLIPPVMRIMGGVPVHGFRVYSTPGEGVLMVTTEAMIPGSNTEPIAVELLDWLEDKGAGEVISLQGLPLPMRGRGQPDEKVVLGFTTARDIRELSSYGVRPIREGAVTGLDACLLEECLSRGLPWTGLMLPTGSVNAVDPEASAAAVGALNRMLALGVDSEGLKRRAEATRRMARARRGGIFDALKSWLSSLIRRI